MSVMMAVLRRFELLFQSRSSGNSSEFVFVPHIENEKQKEITTYCNSKRSLNRSTVFANAKSVSKLTNHLLPADSKTLFQFFGPLISLFPTRMWESAFCVYRYLVVWTITKAKSVFFLLCFSLIGCSSIWFGGFPGILTVLKNCSREVLHVVNLEQLKL